MVGDNNQWRSYPDVLKLIEAETIGFIAGVLGLIAWVPQVAEVWFYKRHEGVSLPTIFTIITALVLWTIYGLLIDSISVIVSNLVAAVLIGIVAAGVINLRLQTS
jgi:MtN3 and saliva related transmembrane protein